MKNVCCLLLLSACASEVPDVDRMLPELDCNETPPLEVGRCIDVRTGGDCLGEEDEVQEFRLVGADETLPLIRGPQGSSMFVLAVRAMDIEPGDPAQPLGSESPLVEIVVVADDGEEMSLLRRRAAFAPDPEVDGMFLRAGFFVIIDDRCPSGRLLTAEVALTDRLGARRCGTLEFEADCSP